MMRPIRDLIPAALEAIERQADRAARDSAPIADAPSRPAWPVRDGRTLTDDNRPRRAP